MIAVRAHVPAGAIAHDETAEIVYNNDSETDQQPTSWIDLDWSSAGAKKQDEYCSCQLRAVCHTRGRRPDNASALRLGTKRTVFDGQSWRVQRATSSQQRYRNADLGRAKQICSPGSSERQTAVASARSATVRPPGNLQD